MKDEIKEILDYFVIHSTDEELEMLSKISIYITNLQEESERYKNIIDELILTGLASSIAKEDFEYMWKVAYNKEYNPNDIKEIAERHGILKGE